MASVWTDIPDSDIDPDSPFTTGLATAYRENVIAAFEGASGAPRLVGKATAWDVTLFDTITIIAANTYALTVKTSAVIGTYSTSSTSFVAARSFTMRAVTGSARFNATHSVAGGFQSTLEIRKNSVQQQQWTTTSATPVARSRDQSFALNDAIDWRHRVNNLAATGTFGSPSETANNRHTEFYALDEEL